MLVAFAATLVFYVLGFSWLEHRRHRLGPWEVTFIQEPASPPMIRINQPALEITNLQVEFVDTQEVTLTNRRVDFVAGREVPFAVPFGQCVFMDPLFLPGTVTLSLFGHEVQMLPRALTIDGHEYGWKSGSTIELGLSD